MVRKEVLESRRLDAQAAGVAWEFDVAGFDWARLSMAGVGAAVTAAVFRVDGSLDGVAWKDTGAQLTAAAPVSDQLDVLTYRKVRAVCTTGEGSALDVVIACARAQTP